jgi:hypothetical protein
MTRGIRPVLRSVLLLLPLVAARQAHAQVSPGGTISDPPAQFTRPVASFDQSPTAHFTGVSADPMTDHLFMVGWWYRIEGDTAEHFFPTPNAESYVGDTSIVTWNDVGGRGFRAVETGVVVNGGGPSGQVTLTLELTNLSGTTPLRIDVFSMADVDLGGTTLGDSATLLVPNERIGIADGADSAEYGGVGADAFLVLPAQNSSGLPDVAARLNDVLLDRFDDTGLPFGPDDFTAGFQWTTTEIPPSGSATFVAGIAVNMALDLPLGPTTTSTITTATTSTTLNVDLCHNCVDDDGNGIIDDGPECCGEEGAIDLRRGSLRPLGEGVAAVKLKGNVGAQPALGGGMTATDDVTIQLQYQDSSLLCAHFPAAAFVRRRGKAIFRDPDHAVASARGVDTLILARRRNGGMKVVLRAKRAALSVPNAGGRIDVDLALRDPATAESGNRCVGIGATFRATKKGLRFPP